MKRFFSIAFLLIASCVNARSVERHVIYVHGKAVEDGGRRPETRFGVYEYDRILQAFRHAGFAVSSEQRPHDADAQVYAGHVVESVRALLRRGVAPSSITVIGASKGAVITMLASTRLQNPDVRYVLLGNCNDSILEQFQPRLSGRVLSIYESSDEFGQSCARFFEHGSHLSEHEEIGLRLGIGHAFLYTPRGEWLEPAIRWARGETARRAQ